MSTDRLPGGGTAGGMSWHRGGIRILVAGIAVSLFLLQLTACGSGGGSSSNPKPTATPTPVVTNSSVFAVDDAAQRAYIPMPFLNANLHGQLAVLDLAVNPDEKNPVVGTIDLGQPARPVSLAVAAQDNEILVLSDPGTGTGLLQIVDQNTDAVTNLSLPTGSYPSTEDGIIYDPDHDTALLSLTGSSACTGSCTGMAELDVADETLGPLITLDNPINNFGYDTVSDIPLASSDPITPELYAPDVVANSGCTFSDENLAALNSDPEGMAVDPSTHIWVAGNFLSSTATVLNLNGATYTSGAGCTLNEAGTPPNSVNQDTGSSDQMPGVAINPTTHEALLTANDSNSVALIKLPSKPETQLTATDLSSISSFIPNNPDGVEFSASAIPYAIVIDNVHNYGYVLESDRQFIVRIDLDRLEHFPTRIKHPLSKGQCAGTSTSYSCSNGTGITYFPLPSS